VARVVSKRVAGLAVQVEVPSGGVSARGALENSIDCVFYASIDWSGRRLRCEI